MHFVFPCASASLTTWGCGCLIPVRGWYGFVRRRSTVWKGDLKHVSSTATCSEFSAKTFSQPRTPPSSPACRNANAEDQLYGTWDPSTHFTEDGPVPAYVSMVEVFAEEVREEGLLLEEDAAAGGAAA